MQRTYALVVAIALPLSALGAESSLCPAPLLKTQLPESRNIEHVELESDYAVTDSLNRFSFSGNVHLWYKTQVMRADSLVYDHNIGIANAFDNIQYEQNGMFLNGNTARFELEHKRGQINGAGYFLDRQHASGEAGTIDFDQQRAQLTDASYSTCVETPRVWELRASDLRLNTAENEGSASNVNLRIYNIPVAYLPYISFSLGGRKSGFLTPSFGNSSRSGVSFGIPYYWNIAPAYDATVVPRAMSKRGLLLQNEFRYLTAQSHGVLHADVVPIDQVRNTERAAFSLTHRGYARPGLFYFIDFNHVSDDDYLREFGGSLDTVSMSYLPREIGMAWYGDTWRFHLSSLDYQRINPQLPTTYRKLPHANFTYAAKNRWIDADFSSDYSYYTRADGLFGHRGWVETSVAVPLRSTSFEIIPRARARHTEYAIANSQNEPFYREQATVPDWNLTGKLFLERVGDKTQQTLTPFVGHTYVPFVNQDGFPLMDTSPTDLRLSRWLGGRSYDGFDRIGDAHFVSGGVHWGWARAPDWRPIANFTVLNAYYLADSQLNMADETPRRTSDLITAGQFDAYLLSQLSANGRLIYDWRTAQAEKGIIQLHYDATGAGINLSYRFRQPQIEQMALAGFMDLQGRWRLHSRVSYSLSESRFQEAAIGTEYDSCCFTVRFTAQYYIDAANDTVDTSLGAEIELKGLASFGESIVKEISQEFVSRRYRYDEF